MSGPGGAGGHPDPNVPKMAERAFQREQKSAQMGGWMLEALDNAGGPAAQLTEDDRSVQLERERRERAKELTQEKKEKKELAEFLSQQRTAKTEALSLGKAKTGTVSVLGDPVEAAQPPEKKSKTKPATVVVVVAAATEGNKKKKQGGGLSLLNAYQ